MTAPTVVHRERVENETAILCANGRIHFGPDFLRNDDPERVREVADKQAERSGVTWCGGAPHKHRDTAADHYGVVRMTEASTRGLVNTDSALDGKARLLMAVHLSQPRPSAAARVST